MSAILQGGKGDVFGPDVAVTGNIPIFDGPTGKFLKDGGASIALPRNWLAGLKLSNGTDVANDINIAPGECRDDTNTADISLSAVITKQLDAAWTAGTNAGGRDTGAIADNNWYLFAIRNPTTGVCDVLFSLSVTTPTLPSGYTQKRRIGAIVRKAGTILAFKQAGDYFEYLTPQTDIYDAQQAPNAFGPIGFVSLPKGFKVQTHFSVRMYNTGGAAIAEIRDNDQASTGFGNVFCYGVNGNCGYTTVLWTDAGANLMLYNMSAPASSVTHWYISVLGYWDTRGKDD